MTKPYEFGKGKIQFGEESTYDVEDFDFKIEEIVSVNVEGKKIFETGKSTCELNLGSTLPDNIYQYFMDLKSDIESTFVLTYNGVDYVGCRIIFNEDGSTTITNESQTEFEVEIKGNHFEHACYTEDENDEDYYGMIYCPYCGKQLVEGMREKE